MDKRIDIQVDSNYWFSLGFHIDHTDPSITIHLPFVIAYIGNCKQPGFKHSIRRRLGLGGSEYIDRACDCCERKGLELNDLTGLDSIEYKKGWHYDYLCNRCLAELGGWDEMVEDVTPKQIDQILEMVARQFEKDGASNAVRFENGLRHYAIRQLLYYSEVVMAGGYGE